MPLEIFGEAESAHWEPGPKTRGTWDLLSTCLITLALCVYTAVHVNIPEHNASVWQFYRIKIKWGLIGLIFPDFIVLNAWRQRAHAKSIITDLNQHYGYAAEQSCKWRLAAYLRNICRNKQRNPESSDGAGNSRPSGSGRGPRWTLTHGFYIVMGGYALDTSHLEQRIWPEGVDRLTIIPEIVQRQIRKDRDNEEPLIPYLSEEQIKDKSKANRLAKFIVCAQALWFCTQFFARIQQKLPVTLLELTTSMHCLCALMSYLFWWHKPLDIEEPTAIYAEPGGPVERLSAILWSTRPPVVKLRVIGIDVDPHIRKAIDKQSELYVLNGFGLERRPEIFHRGWPHSQGILIEEVAKSSQFETTAGTEARNAERVHVPVSQDRSKITLRGGSNIPGTSLRISPGFTSVTLDDCMISRYKLFTMENLREELQRPTFRYFALEEDPRDESSRKVKWERRRRLKASEPNICWQSNINTPVGFISCNLLTVFCYGLLHLLIWNAKCFRTDVEQLLWASSSTVATVALPLILVYNNFAKNSLRKLKSRLFRIFHVDLLSLVMVYFPLLLFAIARVYLILEAFVNLAYVDTAAYQTPEVCLALYIVEDLRDNIT